MNKSLLFTVLLVSCSSPMSRDAYKPSADTIAIPTIVKDTIVREQSVETKTKQTDPVDTSKVQPDTTINKKLILRNARSTGDFFPAESKLFLKEGLRSSPVLTTCNLNGSQYLFAYHFEGDSKNSFSVFEIGYTSALDTVESVSLLKLTEETFRTESGLHLGMGSDDVIRIKGGDFVKTEENGITQFYYHFNNYESSAFLQSVEMPGYFIQIFLKKDEVVKVVFGYDYP